jgi:hypothetical protein
MYGCDEGDQIWKARSRYDIVGGVQKRGPIGRWHLSETVFPTVNVL